MHPHQLRYLRVLYRHLRGPIQDLADGSASAHQIKAMVGVMARLIVNVENEAANSERLSNLARQLMPELETAIGGSDELATLNTLLTQAKPSTAELEASIARIVNRLGRPSNLNHGALYQRFVESDWNGLKQIERDRQALIEQAPMSAEAVMSSAAFGREREIAQWLRQQCGESDALEVCEMKIVPGGFSKQTIFVVLRNNQRIPANIVLRIDRPESPLQTTVVAEFPLLKILHEAGVRVPRPLAMDGHEVIGAPIMAVERASGSIVADGQRFFEKQLPFSYASSLAMQLAQYHQLAVEKLPAGISGQDKSIAEMVVAELETLREIWTHSGHHSIAVETAFNWLHDNLHLAGAKRSLVHGDLRFHNMLVEDGKVSAILDWELASIGNPAFDLGYVYQHIIQLGSWEKFLDAYASAGGEIPSADTLKFYALRTELFTVVYLARMATAFQAGAFEKIELGYAAYELRQHSLFLLADRLRTILAGLSL